MYSELLQVTAVERSKADKRAAFLYDNRALTPRDGVVARLSVWCRWRAVTASSLKRAAKRIARGRHGMAWHGS